MNKIVILGYGAVSKCLLPLILKHICNPKNITIIDKIDYSTHLKSLMEKGLSFHPIDISKKNYQKILPQFLSEKDLFIDLSVNTNTLELIKWCTENHVMYINSGLDIWLEEKDDCFEGMMNQLHEVIELYKTSNHYLKSKMPTIVLEHGANPGLVSHLTKKALIDLSNYLIKNQKAPQNLSIFMQNNDFARIAQCLEIKVIHISEKDTQIINRPKKDDEFINTWSIDGLYNEGIYSAELGWGTHEKKLPSDAVKSKFGNTNSLYLNRSGKNVWVKSWVPHDNIIGMIIPHGEAITINKHLSVYDKDKIVYCPTVHYAYKPTDLTIISLRELDEKSINLHPQKTILNDEIVDGADVLGVLLMGNPYTSWWSGSLLDIHQARKILPGHSATTLQVAGSLISAIIWMKNNPQEGILFPDDMPWEPILREAEPYWGGIYSTQTSWTPHQFNIGPFDKTKPEHEWQFENFLIYK